MAKVIILLKFISQCLTGVEYNSKTVTFFSIEHLFGFIK